MSSVDLKGLIQQNELNLDKPDVDRLLSLNGRKALAALSPDRESGPFLLYCCGDDLEMISAKMNLPKDVVIATAIQYRWPHKATLLKKGKDLPVPSDIRRDLVNGILIATFVAMQTQLGEVISGKRKPEDCSLIPSSPAALEKLMNMVEAANAAAPSQTGPKADPVPQTVIHTEKVEINNGVKAPADESPERAEARKAMLKAVEDSAG